MHHPSIKKSVDTHTVKSLHTRPTENIAVRGVGSNQNVGGQTVNRKYVIDNLFHHPSKITLPTKILCP